MNFQGKRKGKKNWTRWHSRNTQHTEFYKLLHNSTNSTLSHYTLNNIKFVLEQPNCNPPPPSHPDTLIDPQKKKNVPMDLSPSFCFLFFSFYFFIIPCPVCNKAHNRNPSPDLIITCRVLLCTVYIPCLVCYRVYQEEPLP